MCDFSSIPPLYIVSIGSVTSMTASETCYFSSAGVDGSGQNFNLEYDNSLIMTASNSNIDVILTVIFLKLDVDYENAFKVGTQVAKEYNAIYRGINTYAISANSAVQSFIFATKLNNVNSIVEAIRKEMDFKAQDLRIQIIPVPHARGKPPSAMSS
jgi:hypothetical protein